MSGILFKNKSVLKFIHTYNVELGSVVDRNSIPFRSGIVQLLELTVLLVCIGVLKLIYRLFL